MDAQWGPNEIYFNKGEREECPGREKLMSAFIQVWPESNVSAPVGWVWVQLTLSVRDPWGPLHRIWAWFVIRGLPYKSKYKLEGWDTLCVSYPHPWSQQLRHRWTRCVWGQFQWPWAGTGRHQQSCWKLWQSMSRKHIELEIKTGRGTKLKPHNSKRTGS